MFKLILGILGILGIVIYALLPHQEDFDFIFPLEGEPVFLTGDSASGAVFIESLDNGFKCALERKNGQCGLGYEFNSTHNWNRMDSVIFELNVSDNFKEGIIKIFSYDPDYTQKGDRNTYRPLIKELYFEPNKKRYAVYLEDLYVPDYWFEQMNVKKMKSAKRFFALNGFELLAGWENKAGVPLEIRIEKIYAKGTSNTPFTVLVIYICILIVLALGAVPFNRQKKQSKS